MKDREQCEFRKSRHSSPTHCCVEIGRSGDVVRVRDSKAPAAGTLDLPVGAARRLFAALRNR
ncbi:DUF397 domain-containing protein [Actinomadura sp. WMMB 499]|uniref:DUF397 domain-containing protein n=1 Tax=Actinomadura sp. WMMB 499 TaxID=1219491 RepID=UPI0020C80558|nr:DUF397 domain-containing protein [Actinomadura sp. WMMB 499]